jgi:nucleotide-binding universal stress UspA family protein
MRIMVGYDGSGPAKDALELAKNHAKAFRAEVDLVTSMYHGAEDALEKIERAKEELEKAKEGFDAEGIACETHLLIRGLDPGEDLVRFAKEHQVDEIIIGVRRRSKVGKIVLGSAAQYVVMEAHCPVVTIK